jgi:O-antigen ligase
VTLERAQLALLAAIAATSPISIFAAQVLLALALLVYAARLLLRRARVERLPIETPILAFVVWSLLAAAFARDPVSSHDSAKKLILFALLYLAIDAYKQQEARKRILDAAVLGGLVQASFALLQFQFMGFDTLDNRPRSFLGHYMTASGVSMCVLVLAAGRLAFAPERPRLLPDPRDLRRLALLAGCLAALTLMKRADVFALESERLFVAGLTGAAAAMALAGSGWRTPTTSATLSGLALALTAVAVVISRTRSAWLGTLAGLGVVTALRAPRSLWLLPASVAAVLILRPALVVDRLTVTDASSRDRYYMWQAGIDMIFDRPVFGQGPGMITEVYPRYRWPEAPNPDAAHLHDNALQIAAERGLPGLAFWLWLVAALMAEAWRTARHAHGAEPRLYGTIALAVLVALMVAGAFEYNFGDSEILMLVLLVAALPYGLEPRRPRLE